MQGPWTEIGLVLVLVVVNAAFAGSEVALISLREGQLRRMEQEGGRGRLVARLARDPNQFLSTIQIGITLAGFLASAAAAVALAEPLVPLLGFLGGAAEAVAVLLVTVVLTYLTLVIGELAPKRIALQRPEPWAKRAARPLTLVTTLTWSAPWGSPTGCCAMCWCPAARWSPWPPTCQFRTRSARWSRPLTAGPRSTAATWTRSSGSPTWSTWSTPTAASPTMFGRR